MPEKSESTLNDNFTAWILAIATIGLIIAGIAVVSISCFNNPKVQRVELKYIPANTDTIDFSVQNYILSKENLDSIIVRLENHEVQLNQKYQHILQKRDDEDNYRTIFMLVFGIVVSVLGFFGFRSFEDISNKAVSKAKDAAQQKAAEISITETEKTAQQYCKNNLDKLVDISVKKYLESNLQKLVNDKIDALYKGEGRQSIIDELKTVFIENINDYLTNDPGKSFIDSSIQEAVDSSLEDRADTVIDRKLHEKLDQLDVILKSSQEISGEDGADQDEIEDDTNPSDLF